MRQRINEHPQDLLLGILEQVVFLDKTLRRNDKSSADMHIIFSLRKSAANLLAPHSALAIVP